MKQVIFDFDYAQILHDPSLKLGIVVWKHKPENSEYQNAFEVMIEYSKKHDIRNQGVVSPENRKWFESVMIPKAINNGLKRAAVCFDGNVFKKYYINMIIQVINKYGIPLKVFSSEEDAIKWFQSFYK